MRFLIDGYNLLHVMGLMKRRLGPTGLQKARTALIGLLAGALREKAGEVQVIFDAADAPRDVPREFEHRGVHIQFAGEGEEADDLIETLIRRHPTPKNLTVVSDDHRIRKAAERRSCKAQGCEVFLEWLHRQYRSQRPASLEPREKDQGLSEGQTARWLQEFADLADDPALGELFPFKRIEGETD